MSPIDSEATAYQTAMGTWPSLPSVTSSTANVENVVYAPRKPVATKGRRNRDLDHRPRMRARNRPSANAPDTFTRNVVSGNAPAPAGCSSSRA